MIITSSLETAAQRVAMEPILGIGVTTDALHMVEAVRMDVYSRLSVSQCVTLHVKREFIPWSEYSSLSCTYNHPYLDKYRGSFLYGRGKTVACGNFCFRK